MIRNIVTTEFKPCMVYNSSCHFILVPEVTVKKIRLDHLLGFFCQNQNGYSSDHMKKLHIRCQSNFIFLNSRQV